MTEHITGSDNFFKQKARSYNFPQHYPPTYPFLKNNMTKTHFSEGLSSFHHKLIAGNV